ncbi:MAG: ATP synthase subunit I [Methylotenera sp.]|nr:ATP synthase subunit I [Methylotenera sp.]
MLKAQLLATIVVTLLALLLAGLHAGVSAVLGGGSVVIGAMTASRVAKRQTRNGDPTAILLNLLKAEAVKILVIVGLLAIIFNVYGQLVPFALIAGLAAAALFSGAALSRLNV